MMFKREAITINKEGLKLTEKLAEEKLNILNDAINEASKHCKINDLKAFEEDFISYTTKTIVEENEAFKELKIRDSKILDLLEISLDELASIQELYRSNTTAVKFDKNGTPYTKVDTELYKTYTNSNEANLRLKSYKNLINAIEKASKHTHIYRGNISQVTSGAIAYDLRLQDWRINPIKVNNIE